jgi:hypothetical protein
MTADRPDIWARGHSSCLLPVLRLADKIEW